MHSVPGFERAETFRNQVSFGGFVRKMIPLLVITLVFLTVVFAFGYGYLLSGAFTWLASALTAGLCCVVIVALKKRQFDSTWRSATLQLSPWGAVLEERHLRTELPWSGVRQIGAARLMAPVRPPVSSTPATRTVQAGITAATTQPESGLIGAGTLTLRQDAPALLRRQVDQNTRGRAPDPRTGRPLHAIILAQYDPSWPTGRIGDWIRAYRPDLLP